MPHCWLLVTGVAGYLSPHIWIPDLWQDLKEAGRALKPKPVRELEAFALEEWAKNYKKELSESCEKLKEMFTIGQRLFNKVLNVWVE